MTKIIVVLDLTPVRICSNILWFRDQATVSINNLVLSRMFICVKMYRLMAIPVMEFHVRDQMSSSLQNPILTVSKDFLIHFEME